MNELRTLCGSPQIKVEYLSTRCTQRTIRGDGHCVQVAGVANVVGLQLTVGQVPHLGGRDSGRHIDAGVGTTISNYNQTTSSVSTSDNTCTHFQIPAHTHHSWLHFPHSVFSQQVKENIPWPSCPSHRRQWWGCCYSGRSEHKTPTQCDLHPANRSTEVLNARITLPNIKGQFD